MAHHFNCSSFFSLRLCGDYTTIATIGMFIVMQACAKQMSKQREEDAAAAASAANSDSSNAGLSSSLPAYSIVNTASVAGLRGTPAMIAYASSKAAVLAMSVTASKDFAPYGIRVNSISPALIGPGMMWDRQNKLHAESGSPYFASDPEVVARNKINSVPLKRLGTVEEVIKAVDFLLCNQSSYVTGTNLVVDGGMSSGLKA